MPTGRDIICIGASAGGLQPLIEIVQGLPRNLDGALFVGVHTGADSASMLADILRSSGHLPVEVVRDERDIRSGCIHVVPPDHHLLLRRGFVRAVRGPRENGFRPAIDPMFCTAARAYGPRTLAIVLSGGQNDGSSGAVAVKKAKGVVIVQDPVTALVPQMPQSAIASLQVDHVLPAAKIAETIVRLVATRTVRDRPPAAEIGDAADPAEFTADALRTGQLPGPPSSYSCPDCGGALWEIDDDAVVKYRCHVGHGFTAEILLGEKDRELETALWSALRSLEENASLRRRMADRAQGRWPALAESYEKQALDCDDQVAVLRKLLVEARNDAPDPQRSTKSLRARVGRERRRG